MDDDSMTYADGVNTQTTVSMIETKLEQHPRRSQVVSATAHQLKPVSCCSSPTDRACHICRLEQGSQFTSRLSPRGAQLRP